MLKFKTQDPLTVGGESLGVEGQSLKKIKKEK